MRILSIFALLAVSAFGQLQTISDSTLTASAGGGRYTGRIVVSLNAPGNASPLYYLTTSLSGWSMTYCLAVQGSDCSVTSGAGVLNASLFANSTITPSGTSYSARYVPARGPGYTHTWIVPVSASPLKVYQLGSTATPTPTTIFSEAQLAIGAGALIYGNALGVGTELAPGTDGYYLKMVGGVPVWAVVAGGGAGAWGSITGTLSAQTDLQSALDAKLGTSGNAASATILQTARNINGVAFNGSANITVTASLPANPTPCGAGLVVTDVAADGTLTCDAVAFSSLTGAATDAQIPNTITVDLAAAATALANARTIAGVSFNGTANIAIPSTGLSDTATLPRLAAANAFTRGQTITGSADEVQQRVTAHSTQTNYLSVWEKQDGTDLMRLSNDGTLEIFGSGPFLLDEQAAPVTPATAKVALWADPTSKTLQVKDDAGNASTTVRANTGAANQFLTAMSALGVLSRAQPAFTDLSGAATDAQIPDTITVNLAAAATALATTRAIYGNNFDGTAALTQIIASTYGGTGNGFTKFSGATTSEKTYTLPNSSTTIVTTADTGSVTNAMLAGSIDLTSKVTGRLVAANVPARAIGVAVGDPAGSTLATGVLGYVVVPYACTIAGWDIVVDAGTATVDVWKIATGTAKPTVSNTITASAKPAISTGTAIASTTLTSWTTSVSAGDIMGFNLDAVATAKYITVDVRCQ